VEVPQVTVDDLAERGADASVIDVRQPDEYEEYHIPGARLIPMSEVPERVAELAGAETVYVICQTGSRSQRVCEFAAARGYDVANVIGGTLAWVRAGHPIVTGPEPGSTG
jgi:rhodanese-related sulfurtransferase